MYPDTSTKQRKLFYVQKNIQNSRSQITFTCFFLDFETIIQQKHVIATSNIISLLFSKYRCNFIGQLYPPCISTDLRLRFLRSKIYSSMTLLSFVSSLHNVSRETTVEIFLYHQLHHNSQVTPTMPQYTTSNCFFFSI